MITRKSAALLSLAMGGVLLSPSSGHALPFGPASVQLHGTSAIVEVRSRGGAVAAGVLGGLIVGGIIASHSRHYYYGYPPYGYYAPYPPPYAYYRPYPGGAGVAYCLRRFRSYDPVSMTYLGYDGLRHPCP